MASFEHALRASYTIWGNITHLDGLISVFFIVTKITWDAHRPVIALGSVTISSSLSLLLAEAL